jgi:hypothetical protein
MPTASTSLRYDGEIYTLAESIDLGAQIRLARQSASAAGPNTPALLTVTLSSGGQLTIEVGAGTPIAMLVTPVKAQAKAR